MQRAEVSSRSAFSFASPRGAFSICFLLRQDHRERLYSILHAYTQIASVDNSQILSAVWEPRTQGLSVRSTLLPVVWRP